MTGQKRQTGMTDTMPTPKYKPASNVNCLRILAARLSEHLSPAEKREIEKAIAELTATQEALAMAKKEVQRLTDCLAKANAGLEEFERKYYGAALLWIDRTCAKWRGKPQRMRLF